VRESSILGTRKSVIRECAARDAAVAAAGATNEIQGHSRLKKLFFLPLFGFETVADLDALP
jgi:hypothetical protein